MSYSRIIPENEVAYERAIERNIKANANKTRYKKWLEKNPDADELWCSLLLTKLRKMEEETKEDFKFEVDTLARSATKGTWKMGAPTAAASAPPPPQQPPPQAAAPAASTSRSTFNAAALQVNLNLFAKQSK